MRISQVLLKQLNNLPSSLYQALVGQLLGDAHIEKVSANTRISWSFGSKFKDYAYWLAEQFAAYCSAKVYEVNVTAKRGGNSYTNYRLKTATLEVFNALFSMFYVYEPDTGKYKKIVPANIHELMSPITLAHLIMGDGNFDQGRNRVRIYTNSFTYDDCVRLADAISQLGIRTSVMLDRVNKKGVSQYILTIGALQLATLRTTVAPHMHESMLYRIGL